MRCLESFVHLCAAGLFDNHTIEILTLDTDQNNGNKDRVESLIELYNKVKTNDVSNLGGEQRSNTFFSAKLNLYRFFTDYSVANRQTLQALSATKILPMNNARTTKIYRTSYLIETRFNNLNSTMDIGHRRILVPCLCIMVLLRLP